MDRGKIHPIRSLPRLFIPGFSAVVEDELPEIPKEEFDKLHKVLRLHSGAEIAILPNDGTIVRCILEGRSARPIETIKLETQPRRHVTLAQALPKPDKLDEVIRMGTELGVARFVVFPTDRTVVRWDAKKRAEKERRLNAIAREAAEVAFIGKLPELLWAESLSEVLEKNKDAIVLSETEGLPQTLSERITQTMVLVIGPEGGWSPREVAQIGDRAVTMGPRVFRVDTAAVAACALTLVS